jgi:hypothetical protein
MKDIEHQASHDGDWYRGSKEALIAAGVVPAALFPEIQHFAKNRTKRHYKVPGFTVFSLDKSANQWRLFKDDKPAAPTRTVVTNAAFLAAIFNQLPRVGAVLEVGERCTVYGRDDLGECRILKPYGLHDVEGIGYAPGYIVMTGDHARMFVAAGLVVATDAKQAFSHIRLVQASSQRQAAQ